LDSRASYRLYIDADLTAIVALKDSDRQLQYYGGFEYVDKDSRRELGNWVFYSNEDNRVAMALSYYAEYGEAA
jgi:hypothetical protein